MMLPSCCQYPSTCGYQRERPLFAYKTTWKMFNLNVELNSSKIRKKFGAVCPLEQSLIWKGVPSYYLRFPTNTSKPQQPLPDVKVVGCFSCNVPFSERP